jgi:hypothetical protein
MECGAVGPKSTVVLMGLVPAIGYEQRGGGETTLRGTERNGFGGRRRIFCYNIVNIFNKQRRI